MSADVISIIPSASGTGDITTTGTSTVVSESVSEIIDRREVDSLTGK